MDGPVERPRHPEKAHRPDNPIKRKPDWIRVRAPNSPEYAETKRLTRHYAYWREKWGFDLLNPDMDALLAGLGRELHAGDHALLMSNGGFGGLHERLLGALTARDANA